MIITYGIYLCHMWLVEVPKKVDHVGVQTFKVQAVAEHLRRFSWHWRCHAAVDEEPTEEALKCREAYERLLACGVRSTAACVR